MADDQVLIRPMDKPGDLGWVVMAHGEFYASEFGWNSAFEAEVAEIIAAYGSHHDPERETAWIAEADGRRVGCVVVVADSGEIARLRVLLVDPAVRGRRLGSRLVGAAIEFARAAGYDEMVLWTNDVLRAAIQIYLKAGFSLVSEEPHNHYGPELVGQTYKLSLR
jgi:GNAT superfamily N-acetyltransferase